MQITATIVRISGYAATFTKIVHKVLRYTSIPCLLMLIQLNASAVSTCDTKNSISYFGNEAFAVADYQDGTYDWQYRSLQCVNNEVIVWQSYSMQGASDEQILTFMQQGGANMSRIFRNSCPLPNDTPKSAMIDIIIIHDNYKGTLTADSGAMVDLDPLKLPKFTTYYNKFDHGLVAVNASSKNCPVVAPPTPPQNKAPLPPAPLPNSCAGSPGAPNRGAAGPADPALGSAGIDASKCALPSEIGDPIALDYGRTYYDELDYTANAPSPILFARRYDSSDKRAGGLSGTMGNRWTHNYEIKLTAETLNNHSYMVVRMGNRTLYFLLDQGLWKADADVADKLQPTAGGWKFSAVDDSVWNFDTNNKLTTATLRNGVMLTFSTDASGNITNITDNFGRILQIAYSVINGTLLVSQITQPDGLLVKYNYDGNNNLILTTYPDNKTHSYTYQSISSIPGYLTDVIDEKSNTFAHWTYDTTVGSPTVFFAKSVQNAGGVNSYSVDYTLDPTGAAASAIYTNPLGTQFTTTFRTLLASTFPITEVNTVQPGKIRKAFYDNNNNLASTIDYNGNTTSFQYDTTRNLPTQRTIATGTPLARTTSWQWSSVFRVPTQIAEPLKNSTFTLDSKGNVLTKTEQATTDANGSQAFGATKVGLVRTWTYTYNGYGQVLTEKDPSNNTTQFIYNAAGNLTSVVNPLNQTSTLSGYDSNGRVGTITDANGIVFGYTYDLRGRVTQIEKYAASNKNGTLAKTIFQYDAAGNMTMVTMPDNNTLSYSYDAAHRLTQVSDILGNKVVLTLDNAGNVTRRDIFDPTNSLKRTQQWVFDGLSRLKQLLGATSQTTTLQRDDNGNVLTILDPLNRTTSNTYDALNQLTKVTDPATGNTFFQYDGRRQLVSVTDPRSVITSYTVDGLGNQTQLISPDGGVVVATYDASGRVLSRTDAKGQATSYAYDALNRVTLVTYQDGSKVAYTYDAAANGIGKLALVQEKTAANVVTRSTQYSFDLMGRVTSQTKTIGSISYVTAYRYSAGDQLSGITYPSGRLIDYQFNAARQIVGVQLTDNGVVKQLASAISYQPFGNVSSINNGAGQSVVRVYDTDGRVSSYNLGGQTWKIDYDLASRITNQHDLANSATAVNYGYDNLDRLTSATPPTTNYSFVYDANGNRTSQIIGTSTRTYSYPTTSNRLQSITGTPARTYTTDLNGSVSNDGLNQYAYDARGRLLSATTPTGVVNYEVDAFGQRVRKVSPGSDRVYHYDPTGHLISESTGAGSVTRDYVWLGDIPLAVLQ